LVRVIDACTIDVGDTVIHPGASIGVALIDKETADDETVLVKADQAMYEAKQAKAKILPAN
jgi:GGDEF domain-containing protein